MTPTVALAHLILQECDSVCRVLQAAGHRNGDLSEAEEVEPSQEVRDEVPAREASGWFADIAALRVNWAVGATAASLQQCQEAELKSDCALY